MTSLMQIFTREYIIQFFFDTDQEARDFSRLPERNEFGDRISVNKWQLLPIRDMIIGVNKKYVKNVKREPLRNWDNKPFRIAQLRGDGKH